VFLYLLCWVDQGLPKRLYERGMVTCKKRRVALFPGCLWKCLVGRVHYEHYEKSSDLEKLFAKCCYTCQLRAARLEILWQIFRLDQMCIRVRVDQYRVSERWFELQAYSRESGRLDCRVCGGCGQNTAKLCAGQDNGQRETLCFIRQYSLLLKDFAAEVLQMCGKFICYFLPLCDAWFQTITEKSMVICA